MLLPGSMTFIDLLPSFTLPQISLPSFRFTPPQFFFYYVIVLICVIYLICIALLKLKYGYWYSQPLTFRFSPSWTFGKDTSASCFTSPKNRLTVSYSVSPSLSSSTPIYPFITHLNFTNMRVYFNRDRFRNNKISRDSDINSIPFENITDLLNNTRFSASHNTIPCYHFERLAQCITEDTHGLSAFVGIYYRPTLSVYNKNNNMNTSDVSALTDSIHEYDEIQGVSVLLPREKIEYNASSFTPASITAIYVCEHLAWNRGLLNDDESLELLETTEYIQKSREIAGEQTLYRYSDIPWFVTPFSVIYSYGISIEHLLSSSHTMEISRASEYKAGVGVMLVKVSSVNFDMFYTFINDCSRDFRCSIRNPISHIQHLVHVGIYHIYMLVMNKTLVISAYIFGPSWEKLQTQVSSSQNSMYETQSRRKGNHRRNRNPIVVPQRDRIKQIRDHISETSTALVKNLQDKVVPKYDLAGKRINANPAFKSIEHQKLKERKSAKRPGSGSGVNKPNIELLEYELPRMLSSVQNKRVCSLPAFIYGFMEAARDFIMVKNGAGTGAGGRAGINNNNNIMIIDSVAHNYRILDELNNKIAPLWVDKWYYVMYNAEIRQQLLCKDLFMI